MRPATTALARCTAKIPVLGGAGRYPADRHRYSSVVQHRQYYVEQLAASGRDLPLVGGDLMVVRYPENPNLDWELIVSTSELEPIEHAPYQLLISGPEGNFTGDAVLVRSDGRSHVFRGAGDLGGFSEGDFV